MIIKSLFFQGFLVSLAMGILAFVFRTISLSGVIGGVVFGTIIYGTTGWQGFLIPLSFFIIGTLATKHGYKKKSEKGIAQEEGGKRGAKHALANILAGTIFAVIASVLKDPNLSEFAKCAMVGSFATAAADTGSSEMGQVYGKSPINPLTFKAVPVGTEGAISKEGTLWGILASVIVAVIASATVFTRIVYFPAIVIGAFAGNMVESLIGAAGGKKLNNELLNFTNTLIGGLISGLLALLTFRVFL